MRASISLPSPGSSLGWPAERDGIVRSPAFRLLQAGGFRAGGRDESRTTSGRGKSARSSIASRRAQAVEASGMIGPLSI